MIHIKRDDAPVLMKNGRKTYRVFGESNALIKAGFQGAFATFAQKYGAMETHCHENEYMYVIDAKDAHVSFGEAPDDLRHRQTLHKGDIIRPHEGEWHRFDFSSEDGFVDFLNLFAVPAAHVRTEDEV